MEPGDAAWSRAEAAWLAPPEPENCPDCEDGIVERLGSALWAADDVVVDVEATEETEA